MPANLDDLAICRIVVRHGLRRDLSDLLLDDLRRSSTGSPRSRTARPSAVEDGGFSHT